MFSTSDIVQHSTAKSFERGQTIALKDGSVTERRFVSGRSICEVSGEVRSQSGIAERFDAFVTTDASDLSIVDSECTCPAARKHDTMCKHCVALALAFKSDPSSFIGYEDQFVVSTSRSLKRFMDRAPERAALRIDAGSAHLEPTLHFGFGEWSLRLKVSVAGARYVVSDIGAFGRAFLGQSFMSYGKKLGFVHSADAFDEASRPIAAFVADKVSEMASTRRELPLAEADVVELLDLVGECGANIVNEERPSSSGCIVPKDGNPGITLRIIASDEESGAYEIVRDDQIVVATSAKGSYVLMDDGAYRCTPAFAFAASFLRDVYLSADDEIVIAKEDAPAFCAKVLPRLACVLDVSYPEELEAYRPKEARFSFFLDKAGRGRSERIELVVKASYGGQEIELMFPPSYSSEAISDEEPPETYRDPEAEEAMARLVAEYFEPSMQIPLDDEEAAGQLLFEGIARLREAGDVYTTPDFDRLTADKRVRVQIGLSLAGNLVNMDIQPTDVSTEELAEILGAYQRHKRYHRLKDGTIASLLDMELAHLDRMAQDLGISARDLMDGKVEVPSYAAFFLDREYADAFRSVEFEEYVNAFDNDDLYTFDVPSSMEGSLRPYQLDGYRWLRKLAQIGFGGILADEMGLGKTVQAISFLVHLKESGKLDPKRPALIVCPASLVYNWVEEFARFAPSLGVCALDGDKAERRAKRRTMDADVLVASYDTVRMDTDVMSQIAFSAVILDEAQFIKNHATKTARAVKRLDAAHRFALTGTPIENRLSEIWSIFDFLMPGFLGTYAQFRRRFEADILGGDEDVARRLQALVSPFVLRRLKKDVLLELPEKQESVVSVVLAGDQRRLYDAHEQSLRENLLAQRRERSAAHRSSKGALVHDGLKVDVLAELMKLRQVALDPSLAYSTYHHGSAKTDAIVELVREAFDSGRKSLVFSQFTSYLDILKKRLDEEGLAYYEITGSTPKKARVELVNKFNNNDVPVFLVSLKAGGTGLNLIGASVVIHADPWWNAAAINQATDRAHRIGQQDMVSVYKVIAKDTIEERILRLQQAKEDLAGSVIGETSLANLSSLTREELESLLLD